MASSVPSSTRTMTRDQRVGQLGQHARCEYANGRVQRIYQDRPDALMRLVQWAYRYGWDVVSTDAPAPYKAVIRVTGPGADGLVTRYFVAELT